MTSPTWRSVVLHGNDMSVKLAQRLYSSFPSIQLIILSCQVNSIENVLFQSYLNIEEIRTNQMDVGISIGKPLKYHSTFVTVDPKVNTTGSGHVGRLCFLKEGAQITPYMEINEHVQIHEDSILQTPWSVYTHNAQCYLLYRDDDLKVINDYVVNLHKVKGIITEICQSDAICLTVEEQTSCLLRLSVSTDLSTRNCRHLVGDSVRFVDRKYDESMRNDVQQQIEKALPQFIAVSLYNTALKQDQVSRKASPSLQPTDYVTSSESSDDSREVYGILSATLVEEDEENGFYELGGDSLAVMRSFTDLTHAGYNIDITEFFKNPSAVEHHAKSKGIPQLKQPNSNVLPSGYQLQKLTSTPRKEEAIKLLSREFSRRNPLDVLAGTTEASLEKLLWSMWEPINRDDLSIVVVNLDSGAIVGVTIVLDLQTELHPVRYCLKLTD